MSLTPERPDRPTSARPHAVHSDAVHSHDVTPHDDRPDLPSTAPGAPRDPGTLRALLERVDAEGWDGPSGTALLGYVRETIVRPLAIDRGMRGAASGQAEAWEDVWDLMREPGLRTAESPWGCSGVRHGTRSSPRRSAHAFPRRRVGHGISRTPRLPAGSSP